MVVPSDEFSQEIVEHPIPTDLEAVKVFASAPAVLGIVMWLTYRCFVAKSEERIPRSGRFGLAAQLGCDGYSWPRRFRAMLEQWLSRIRAPGHNAWRPSARMDGIFALLQHLQYSPVWADSHIYSLPQQVLQPPREVLAVGRCSKLADMVSARLAEGDRKEYQSTPQLWIAERDDAKCHRRTQAGFSVPIWLS